MDRDERLREAAHKWMREQDELGERIDHQQGLSEYRLDAAEQGYIAGYRAALASPDTPQRELRYMLCPKCSKPMYLRNSESDDWFCDKCQEMWTGGSCRRFQPTPMQASPAVPEQADGAASQQIYKAIDGLRDELLLLGEQTGTVEIRSVTRRLGAIISMMLSSSADTATGTSVPKEESPVQSADIAQRGAIEALIQKWRERASVQDRFRPGLRDRWTNEIKMCADELEALVNGDSANSVSGTQAGL